MGAGAAGTTGGGGATGLGLIMRLMMCLAFCSTWRLFSGASGKVCSSVGGMGADAAAAALAAAAASASLAGVAGAGAGSTAGAGGGANMLHPAKLLRATTTGISQVAIGREKPPFIKNTPCAWQIEEAAPVE